LNVSLEVCAEFLNTHWQRPLYNVRLLLSMQLG
jgi:hypothetical protein